MLGPKKTKICTSCKKDLPLESFYKDKRVKDRRYAKCRSCCNEYNRTTYSPKLHKEIRLKREYGITLEEYEMILKFQDGVCKICSMPERAKYGNGHVSGKIANLAVDHDHKTGKVRGLLCSRCNRGIGYFEDSPERLLAAAKYLEEAQQ